MQPRGEEGRWIKADYRCYRSHLDSGHQVGVQQEGGKQPSSSRVPRVPSLVKKSRVSLVSAHRGFPCEAGPHRECRGTHGVPQENEQLLQAWLTQKLHFGLPEGESSWLDAQGQMGSGVEGRGSLSCVSVAPVNSCLPGVCVLSVYVLHVDCVDFVCV